ncbi:MAG: CoA transferase [SAR324 cluster bacterium]|nr:CoA transferase [SAR324 cluster bacterium]
MGPLHGKKIIELAGIGPGPFCGMMLSDMGAEVVRIDRIGKADRNLAKDVLSRGRLSVAVNLKSPEGRGVILKLCEKADGLFEGFRPGVTERLGIGPVDCMSRNPKLVYGRMTGWGQDGPLAQAAGHDINYIALSGALHAIGFKGSRPVPPLNLVGDFGGGGMYLAFGIVCALLEAQNSGKGQVIDVSMVEGSASLLSMFYGLKGTPFFASEERGSNLLDGGAHFYNTYETKDGKYISIGPIEAQFYSLLIEKTGIDPDRFSEQMEMSQWPEKTKELAEVFKTKTQKEWCRILEGSDICFAPVLSISEAPQHPHNKARGSFIELEGLVQPAPTPRFSRSVPEVKHAGRNPGEDTRSVLEDWGFSESEIEQLQSKEAINH